MFELNGTYVIFLVLFLVFIRLLNEIMLKPVGQALEKRRARLQNNMDATKACTQEAQNLLTDYQAKLHQSRLEGQAIIQSALAESQKDRNEKLKRVNAEGRAKLEELKNELTANRKNLFKSLIHPELDLVRGILNKLLGESPNLVTSEEKVLQTMENIR